MAGPAARLPRRRHTAYMSSETLIEGSTVLWRLRQNTIRGGDRLPSRRTHQHHTTSSFSYSSTAPATSPVIRPDVSRPFVLRKVDEILGGKRSCRLAVACGMFPNFNAKLNEFLRKYHELRRGKLEV
ncbi:hypothetical protein GWI33_011416 [Rhynchophorus ferrugineus]|uniref:Uncharacterized protein n=1 Tax=Rhynchophorus ferrugineus TaxID=354439 RepID=A0A834IQD1_RHYFE|nr:hypothetical protein GWI33_011416 [Rhynchophorus ferrugineus]